MFAAVFWGALLIGGTVALQVWLDARAAARAPRAIDGAGPPGIELVADRRGHYVVVGRVNDREVEFLVDTGASEVAVPAELARELGLRAGRAVGVQTANGRARARSTTIDRLAVGPLERRNVAASIVPGMSGRTALLGMSFLRRFELVQRDGRLLLREPRP